MGAEKKWLFTLFSAALLSLILLLFSTISAFTASRLLPSSVHRGLHHPPAFSYYIYGGHGDKDRIFRLLLAVYHPRNRYLLHLNQEASDGDRQQLAAAVKSVPAIQAFGNVDVVGKPDRMTYSGSSYIAATLHAAAILLKIDSGWDWFITLSAKDYPLITQDGLHITVERTGPARDEFPIYANISYANISMYFDLAHVLSSVRRDLNFIQHTSDIGWKESKRVNPIVVDPAVYLARRSQIFHATEQRPTPDAFKIFTGSPWVILSRSFLEFCVLGWDNLPRKLLMYFTNVVWSQEGYFHSVICNSPEFKNKTVNSDLRYMIWDNPPKMDPHFLHSSNFDQMSQSGAAFARQFQQNDPVLNMVDKIILNRKPNRPTPGAWCSGWNSWWTDPCSQWGDVNVLKPGFWAKKFEKSITNLYDELSSQPNQCK